MQIPFFTHLLLCVWYKSNEHKNWTLEKAPAAPPGIVTFLLKTDPGIKRPFPENKIAEWMKQWKEDHLEPDPSNRHFTFPASWTIREAGHFIPGMHKHCRVMDVEETAPPHTHTRY